MQLNKDISSKDIPSKQLTNHTERVRKEYLAEKE